MQHPFSCVPRTLLAIEAAISPARLARYLPEARGDKQRAVRLYVWNARLCEAFYLPLQLAEVCVRNAIHKTVERRFSASWFGQESFKAILPPRLAEELARVASETRKTMGPAHTADHVVAGLTFGFWLNLLTRSYVNHLWLNGLGQSFPRLPKSAGRQELYNCLDRMRMWRNKIAHHDTIFDRNPRAEIANILQIVDWVCADTHWFATELASVVQVLSRKPRF